MSTQSRVRSDLLRSLDRSLIGIALAAVLLACIELSLFPLGAPGGFLLAGIVVTFLVYVGAGIVAWHRRPSNRMGFLIVLAGFAIFLGGIANTEVPALVALGAIAATLALPAIIQLLLSFPTGRLSTTPARIVVAAGYLISMVFQAPLYLLDPRGPYPPFAIADEPELLAALRLLQALCGGVIMVSVAAILVARLMRADRSHRRVLAPVFSYGILAVLFFPLSSLVLSGMLGMDPTLRGTLQFAVVTGIPIAFALGILSGGFARTGELEELASWLAAEAERREPLQAALARALGDPSVRLYFWAPDSDAFVDEAGRAAVDDPADARRGWAPIVLGDRTIGAIAYDASLVADRERVAGAGHVVAIAMERQRLTAELRASQIALVRSRERIIDAADRERRRVARDLHDGLQVQLVLLALEAQRISKIPGNPQATTDRAALLRADVDDAAGELRRLVHELVPATLIERGLEAAATDLADRMPMATTVEVGSVDGRLPESVETTAYFVVAEALTNIVKHAQASSARVQLHLADGTLRVRVADDGRGGADPVSGTGLQGLADRVDAVGGTMRVQSEARTGTVLTVELPCAS